MDEPAHAVAALQDIAAAHPDATVIAIASADWHVRTLVERRAELEPRIIVPYVDVELLDRGTSKVAFAQLCEEYGLPHPRTVVADLSDDATVDTSGLRFPVIAKAGDSGEYHAVSFPGKEKVFTVHTAPDLEALLTRLREAGFRGTFIIQDLIPGDDAGLRINNSYVDQAGKVSFTCLRESGGAAAPAST
jgi:D-aspartate ligase